MASFGRAHMPQEIIDSITSYLFNDKLSLASCSLISRAFTPSSQRHLFYSFSLCVANHCTEGSTQHFQTLLSTLWSQLEYVRVLHISVRTPGPPAPCLVDILDRLDNVKEVSINCDLGSLVDDLLVHHCCRSTITHFSIIHASNNFPSYLLRRCTSLQGLTLTYSSLPIPEGHAPDIHEPELPQVRIKSLVVNEFPPYFSIDCWMKSPSCPIDVSSLNSFSIRVESNREFSLMLPIFPIISHSLRRLSISPPEIYQIWTDEEDEDEGEDDTGSSPYLVVDLSILPQLNELEFSISEDCAGSYSLFPWVLSQLTTVSATQNIRSLSITVNLSGWETDFTNAAMKRKWQRLDKFLAGSMYDMLKEVYIRIKCCNGTADDPSVDQLRAYWVEGAMSKTVARKSLCVSMERL